MFVFDTDICVQLLRRRLPLWQRVLKACAPSTIGIPDQVRLEVLVAALRSREAPRNLRIAETFLAPFMGMPFDSLCAGAAARLTVDPEGPGAALGLRDLQVAATALRYEAVLVSNRPERYQGVPGLTVQTWSEFAS